MRYLTNRQELGDILHREGINPNTYALDGGHPSERYVLDIRPGGWAVYYSERGLESGRREFDSEDEACNYLLDKLRSDPTTHFHLVVGPLPEEEADRAFDAWKIAAGLTGIDATDVKVDNPVFAEGQVRRYWVRGTVLPR
jgi:hypothetical protein